MASVAAGLTVKAVLLKVGKAVGLYVAGKLLDKATDALSGSTRESVVRRIEGQKINVRSTQASLPVVYGIQRVGLIVNDVRNASSPGTFFSGATGKDVLVKSGAIAIGSEDGSGIQAVDNIRVYDDGDYAITSPASFPSSAVNTNVALPYTNYLKYIIQDGDDAQTVPSDLGTAMGWSADYKARGVAYGAFFCLYNENVWKRGVPQITMDVTGNRVYDPRTSSWIGYAASGASSDNPALCILDYLTSKRYGAGIPYATRDGGTLDFIDEQSFEDAADYCDVLVNTYTAGPQEKRFRMNAVVDTSRVVSANLVEMLATCRGELVWQNGKYRLIIRQAQTAQSFELTEDNIVGALDWTRKGTSVPNLIEATFPNESGDDYVADSIQFPPVGTTTYLDEDNGIENRLEIALPYTTSIYQAQRTVETMLKELRSDVYVSLTATQAAYTLQVGDVVNVTHSGPQWSAKGFVVRSVALTADGLVGLGLQEYDATAYTVTTPDQETADDAIDLPDPQRAFITISMAGDRFISQGATTSGGVAAQQWKRRLNFRTGINTRSVNIVYDFDRPDIGDVTSTNFSRNYTVNVTPDSEVTHILEDGASGEQIFLARDDNGNTKYDEAISVTITPNDTTGGGGQDGTVVTTQILDLALEDDLGFRVDAEVEVVEANYAEANGDAWFSFTTSIAYWAQGFTMPAGTDRDLASVEVYLQRVGSPTGDVNLYVYDNNATPTPDEPNASVAAATTSVDASTLSASGQVVRLDMDRVSLTAGGSYWVVVEHIDSSGTDYVQIRVDESSPNGSDMTDTATSPEIVSWTVSDATVRQAAGFYVRRFGTQVVPTRQLAPAADKSAKFTWQSDGTVALASVTSGGGGGASTLAGLTDTTITTPGSGDFLRYNGSAWLNTPLVAGDIPDLDAAKITTGTFAIGRIPVASIDHDSLLNFVANEHVDHSGVSISTGDGLSGGGDITATRTLTLDIDGLTDVSTETSPDDKMLGTDQLVFSRGSALFKDTANTIPLSAFSDDLGYTNITASLGVKRVSNDIQVEYAAGANSLYGASPSGTGVGTLQTTDRILFADDSDSFNVKHAELSQLPFTNNSGTVTGVTAGVGLDSSGGAAPNITLDLNELGVGGALIAGDHLVAVNGTATQKQLISAIPLGIFSNNLGWTSNAGTVTQVDGTGTVSGLTLTGSVTSSGSLTLGGTLSVLEGDIVDDSILARLADDETVAGTYSFTVAPRFNGWLALQNETAANDPTAALAGYQTLYSYDNGSTFELRTIVSDSPNPDLVRNIPLIRRTVAASDNQLLVSTGTDHEADWSSGSGSNELTWDGANLNIAGTGGFTGDGSGLDNVVADSSTVTDLGVNANTYYPIMADGTSGSVAHFIESSDLFWNNGDKRLEALNLRVLNDLTMASSGDILMGSDGEIIMGSSGVITSNANQLRDKIRVWNSGLYTIGMKDGYTFGSLNDYAMSFQMNGTAGRGWWWGIDTHTDAQGVMSLNNVGELSVADSIRVGYGTSDTTAHGTDDLDVSGTSRLNGAVTVGGTLKLSQAATVMTRMTNTNNTDLSWDQRVSASGVYEIRSVTDAGTTVLNAFQMVHATGQMRVRDGSRLLPTFSFGADTNIGMYRLGSNSVGYVGDTHSLVTVGGTTDVTLRFLQTATLRARIRYENAGQSLLFDLGTGTATRLKLDPIDATSGRSSFLNGQVHATEYQTQYEDTGTVVLDWDKGNQLLIDFDSTSTTTTIDINETVMQAGGSYVVLLQYNSGSAQTVAWTGTGLLWANGDVPTTATGATAGDITVCQFFKTTTATDKIIGSYFVVT